MIFSDYCSGYFVKQKYLTIKHLADDLVWRQMLLFLYVTHAAVNTKNSIGLCCVFLMCKYSISITVVSFASDFHDVPGSSNVVGV